VTRVACRGHSRACDPRHIVTPLETPFAVGSTGFIGSVGCQAVDTPTGRSAVGEPTPAALADLLRQARRNNERAGLTGMLLYTQGSFFQVLEGAPEAVDRVFGTIAADPRHMGAVTIIRERIARRAFGEWSMGYVTATSGELVAAGLNDFFAQASCFDHLDEGRAKKLLAAFRGGRWRARPSSRVREGEGA
jgi:hypothetical protein